MDRTVPFLNGCVSFVVFVTTLTLVLYMVVAFATGLLDIALLMRDTVLLEPAERQSIFTALNTNFLHNIAILLILMKAYRILVEYLRYHHIDLKFVVEITIIACVLELLFNYTQYSTDMRIALTSLAITFLAVYVFKYDVLVKSSLDTAQVKNAPVPTPSTAVPLNVLPNDPKKLTQRLAAKKTTASRRVSSRAK